MDGGQTAEAKATDPMEGLNPRERKLVTDTLRDYPELSPEQAIEMLREFGGL